MRLTMKYRGKLVATTTSNSRVLEKHEIRNQFHEQIKAHWDGHSLLKDIDPKKCQVVSKSGTKQFDVQRPLKSQDGSEFFWRYPLGGFNFVPLANHVHEFHCELSIKMYRVSAPGSFIFSGGDVDNRLKTLFDALRMPHEISQFPAEEPANPDEDSWPVFHCLLQDDDMITKLSIESVKLLMPVPPGNRPENYVELDIEVNLRPITPMFGTLAYLFG